MNWILDADIRDFFGSLSHEWLVKFIEHRVADRRLLLLIRKLLRAGSHLWEDSQDRPIHRQAQDHPRNDSPAKLGELKGELRRRWHRPMAEVGAWLRSVVQVTQLSYGARQDG